MSTRPAATGTTSGEDVALSAEDVLSTASADEPRREGSGLLEKGRRSVAATLLQKAATPLLSIAVTVLLARNLSVQDYGVYGLFQGTMKYLALFSSLGVTFVVQRYVPEFRGKGDDGRAKQVVWTALMVRAVAIAVVSAVVLAAFGTVGSFFKIGAYERLFSLFLIGVALYLEAGVILQALNSLFMHPYAVAGQVAFTVCKAALLASLLALGFTLRNVVLVEVVSFAVLFGIYAAAYRRGFSRSVARTPLGREHAGRLARYGGFSIVNEVGTTFFSEATDHLIIGHFLSAAALAPYFLATQVARQFGKLNIINQFQSVFTPLFFSAYVEDEARLDAMFRFLVKLSLFLVLPGLVGFVLLGQVGLGLVFGEAYAAAYPLIVLLVVFLPVSAMSLANGLVLQSLERVDVLLYSRAFALYNLVVNIILVQRFGVIGVAFGTASAVLLKNAFTLFYAIRLGRVSLPLGSLARLTANSLATGLTVWLLRSLVTGVAGLAFVTVAAVVVFLVACFANRVFTAEEAAIIDRVAGRRVWVW